MKIQQVGAIAFAICSLMTSKQEQANAQGTAVTITSPTGARQAFGGFGTSQNNWGGEYQTLSQAQRTSISQMLWRDLKFKILRMWFNTDEYAPTRGAHNLTQMRTNYINSGMIADALANGATTLLLAPDKLPPYMRNGNYILDSEVDNYAIMLADAIKQMKDEDGVTISATGIQNEPNNANNGPGQFTPAQMVQAVKTLRTALNNRGLQSVKIIASEAGSCDDTFFADVDALKNDSAAWNSLAGISSHSYSMAATDGAANRIAASDGSNTKEYWMTEASDNGPESPGMTGIPALRAVSLAGRFLNDMNHRVTHWVHFIGFDTPDQSDNATRIGYYTTPASNYSVTVFKKYYAYQQLAQAFDVGAVFRDSYSSLEGDMTWTYGNKPRITSSSARNPDGSWSIGVTNFTAGSFSGLQGWSDEGWNSSQNGYTPAQNFNVTIKIDELRYTNPITFAVKKTDGTLLNGNAGNLTMIDGQLTLPVNSLDLITLRSTSPITFNAAPTPTPVPGGKIRYWPRTPYGSRMQYGVFEGTNGDKITGPWTTLATINTAATEGQWNQVPAPETINYRYVRYRSAAGGYGNVAEIEFYSNNVKLTGIAYGSAPYAGGPNTFTKAFDNDTSTFFDSNDTEGYAGLDLGTTGPTPTPGPTSTPTPIPSATATPTPSPTATPTPTTPPLGNGTGLKGQYYSDRNLSNIVMTRTDPNINFDWGSGSAMTSVGPDNFSVRWTGQIQAVESGSYTFYVTGDDGVRLWVNNQQLINDWTSHPPTTYSGTITLTAGQKYDIKLEFYEETGGASVKLEWQRPGQGITLVPQSQLYPPSTVSPNLPTVSLTSPTNGSSFTTGSTINIAANASDSDGTISKVEFFQGTTKLGEDLVSPYTYSWTGAAAGNYSLTAKATDNGGNSSTSATVNITVTTPNVPPTVNLTSPTHGASFTTGTAINLAANAADSDGTISKVEFFQGTTKLGEDLVSPYTYSWTGAAAGSYSLTAKATDNTGTVTTSSVVNITVSGGTGTSGTVKREIWTGVSGNTVGDIPTGTTPTTITTLTSLEAPSNIGDQYGQRISGYITAPTTGSYTFWIAGDDAGDFWLSTNSSPTNKVKRAYFYQYTGSQVWNSYPEQKSVAITLTAGQKYYFEILHKEGAGGDSIAVGWLKPGQSGTVPSEVVPGSVLSENP
ncbi:hypothetical protein EON83_12780 [bacterium]|nr:MAG: hypothetical protein EON83_12780 [bacterium]